MAWLGAALVLLAAGTCAACASSADEPQPMGAPLPENLRFSGAVAGRLVLGERVAAPATSNPAPSYAQDQSGNNVEAAPTKTQCSAFPVSGLPSDYVAVVTGAAGHAQVALTIEVNQDQPAYDHPGLPLEPGDNNRGGSVELYEANGPRRWQQVLGPGGAPAARITLDPGRRSGHLEAWLGPTDMSQYQAPPQVHVVGDWRCD